MNLADKHNAAAMREALKRAWLFISATRESFAFVHAGRIERDKLCEDIDAALAAPPRNCDVGTAEEQVERYMNFCHNYPKCTGCPCVGRMQYHKCEFAWAQLPYEKGGAK